MTIHLESNNQIQQNVNAAQENRVEAQPRNEALGNARAPSKLATAGRILLGIVTLGISEGIRALVHHFTARTPAQSRINREPQVRNAPRIAPETQVNTDPLTEDAPQTIDIQALKQSGAKIPANFIQAGKEALQEIYSKFGVSGTSDEDLENTVKRTFKRSSTKNQNTLELGQVKEFFESNKLDIIRHCADQALKSKVPNFENTTGCPVSTISRMLIGNDQNLVEKLQNCASKTDFDALINDLASRLQNIETKVAAIRADYDAAYSDQVKDFAKQSGIDEKALFQKFGMNQTLSFSNIINHNVADFAKEDFSVKDAKDCVLGILENTFKDLKASLKTVQLWKLPDNPTYTFIVLNKICVNNDIQGKKAEMLTNIVNDEHLYPKDLVGKFLHASSRDACLQIAQEAVKTMGQVLNGYIQTAFEDLREFGAEDQGSIANILAAKLMPTFQGTNPGPAQLQVLRNFMQDIMHQKIFDQMNSPIAYTLLNLIEACANRSLPTKEVLTEGLETLIAQKSGIELKGMQFHRFQAQAEIILDQHTSTTDQKSIALQSLANEYAKNQASVLKSIQDSDLLPSLKARLTEAVLHLGACDNNLFAKAMSNFITEFAKAAGKISIKADEAGLMTLMKKLEDDYAKFVKEHLNGTEPTEIDKTFLKECALRMLAENQTFSKSFEPLINDLKTTMADKYTIDNSAYQNALSYLMILEKSLG